MLPGASGGDRASLQRVFRECGFRPPRRARLPPGLAAGATVRAEPGTLPGRCDALVKRIVFPIAERLAGARAEFSIVLLSVDLHEVRADLDRRAAGHVDARRPLPARPDSGPLEHGRPLMRSGVVRRWAVVRRLRLRLQFDPGVLLYLLVVVALRNSYGGITHGSHFLIYVGFAFLFLPPGRRAGMSRGGVPDCIMVLWFAQSIVLLAYSLAGFWKLWASGPELLAADGFVRILLHHLMDTTRPVPPLMPFLARHGHLAQLLFLGVVYVEICSLAVLFRPHLHRPWGIALILAHFGAAWALGVAFPAQQFVVGLLFVCSPLAPARFSLPGTAQSLPVLGLVFRYTAGRRPGAPPK